MRAIYETAATLHTPMTSRSLKSFDCIPHSKKQFLSMHLQSSYISLQRVLINTIALLQNEEIMK